MMQRDVELMGVKSLSEPELLYQLEKFNERYKQLISDSPVADEKAFDRHLKENLLHLTEKPDTETETDERKP